MTCFQEVIFPEKYQWLEGNYGFSVTLNCFCPHVAAWTYYRKCINHVWMGSFCHFSGIQIPKSQNQTDFCQSISQKWLQLFFSAEGADVCGFFLFFFFNLIWTLLVEFLMDHVLRNIVRWLTEIWNVAFQRLEAEWFVIVDISIYHLSSSIGGMITSTVMQKSSPSSAFLI